MISTFIFYCRLLLPRDRSSEKYICGAALCSFTQLLTSTKCNDSGKSGDCNVLFLFDILCAAGMNFV